MSASQPETKQEIDARRATARVHAHELAIAIRNGLKLGGSLILTWSVALIVKLQIPAHLGPVLQGHFGFAEGFATMFFAVAGLGIDTYVIKEVPVRPAHASDFVGGVFALRMGLALALFAAMTVTLHVTGRSDEVQLAAFVFGVSQLLMSMNATLAAILQAVSHVGALAIANVLSKAIWGAGLLTGLHYGAPMWALALPMAGSELLRTLILVPAAHSAAHLRYRINVQAVRTALIASIPFFANGIAITFGNNLAISALEYIRQDSREVGWFAASHNIASLAMMLHPLFAWVVMPMLSRAQARSPEEMASIVRGAVQGLLIIVMPVAVLISAGSDIFVKLAFGERYAPAALGLSVHSLVFLMSYLNIVVATALILINRSWTVTWTSVSSLVVMAAFELAFVPLGRSLIGEGGECAGAAVALIGSEAVAVVVMNLRFPYRVFDRRNIEVLVKGIVASTIVLTVNHLVRDLGIVRLVLDMVLYLVLALVLRILTIGDIKDVVSMLKARRAERGAATSV